MAFVVDKTFIQTVEGEVNGAIKNEYPFQSAPLFVSTPLNKEYRAFLSIEKADKMLLEQLPFSTTTYSSSSALEPTKELGKDSDKFGEQQKKKLSNANELPFCTSTYSYALNEITPTVSISPPPSPMEILDISEDKGASSSTSLLGVKDFVNTSTNVPTLKLISQQTLEKDKEITQSAEVSQSDETPNTPTKNETGALTKNEIKKPSVFDNLSQATIDLYKKVEAVQSTSDGSLGDDEDEDDGDDLVMASDRDEKGNDKIILLMDMEDLKEKASGIIKSKTKSLRNMSDTDDDDDDEHGSIDYGARRKKRRRGPVVKCKNSTLILMM